MYACQIGLDNLQGDFGPRCSDLGELIIESDGNVVVQRPPVVDAAFAALGQDRQREDQEQQDGEQRQIGLTYSIPFQSDPMPHNVESLSVQLDSIAREHLAIGKRGFALARNVPV
jgi:hypothetical protein